MPGILLIGAGRSSSSLIKYFLDRASTGNFTLTVADVSEESAKSKTGNHPAAKPIGFDINNDVEKCKLISGSDLVISMLPANMHMPVALECLKHRKNLVTASYVSAEMNSIDSEVKKAGLIFLNECGLDPGIDHMSAMEIIDKIREEDGVISEFRSYTGGLVAPESNDNPWGYKFSWNPRNVILAGQGTAKFIENGKYRYVPYSRLFTDIREIKIDKLGSFDGYANRDSLSYRKIYGLENIPTMVRGTLRHSGFCKAWNVFVQLGLTDDTYVIENSDKLTYRELVESLLPSGYKGNTLEKLSQFMNVNVESREMNMVDWTGIFEDEKIGILEATPAKALQHLLERKWKLSDSDKDMIVMQHQFKYSIGNREYKHVSSLVVKGENSVYTAMAKTVGLPVAIAAKNILEGKIKLKGVQVPVDRSVYEPVLKELHQLGISFTEEKKELVLDAGNNRS